MSARLAPALRTHGCDRMLWKAVQPDAGNAPHPCCRDRAQNVTSPQSALGIEELERLRPGLRLMALRALGTVQAADEAAQEPLARAIVALQNGQPGDPEKIPAFVTGIARHV